MKKSLARKKTILYIVYTSTISYLQGPLVIMGEAGSADVMSALSFYDQDILNHVVIL